MNLTKHTIVGVNLGLFLNVQSNCKEIQDINLKHLHEKY